MRLSRRALLLGASIAAVASGGPVWAQNYPERPVTIIIPFAPGGGTDAVARAMGPIFGQKLGGTVVIENVSGGAGNIASSRVARAEPDGYTLIMHNVAFALNATLYPKATFDPEKDFAPIAFLNTTPLVHVGRKDLPVNSIPELVTWMKGNIAKLAHPGVGSSGHIAAALLAKAAGAKADMIPYRGGGPALQDVISGQVDITAVTLQNAIEPINGGLVKGVGITSPKRAKQLPQVPSLVQELNPDTDFGFWNMLLAPAGTPKPIIDKLGAALDETLKDPQLLDVWDKAGIDVYPKEERTPEAARAMLHKEIERWRAVIRENKIEAMQ